MKDLEHYTADTQQLLETSFNNVTHFEERKLQYFTRFAKAKSARTIGAGIGLPIEHQHVRVVSSHQVRYNIARKICGKTSATDKIRYYLFDI